MRLAALDALRVITLNFLRRDLPRRNARFPIRLREKHLVRPGLPGHRDLPQIHVRAVEVRQRPADASRVVALHLLEHGL
eukprot:CAMPEP_0115435936 /NCGR_PEP_ID=MMETSP0271-20121206/33922_1 /TAXON_ID=71861 /ORGANISM="Scrippsiella trochoidea, Strain CCMP3099" /LENGTH=78 /DNA_ID=CAMNT_0002861421 /DNA_START=295 /DNA_END=531 /DNA_ORIENTATION=+